MYLIVTQDEVHGIFSTEQKAQEAIEKIVEAEFADWLTNGCSIDELLAESNEEEYALYKKGEITVEQLSVYETYRKDWANEFYIIPMELDEIKTVNLN